MENLIAQDSFETKSFESSHEVVSRYGYGLFFLSFFLLVLLVRARHEQKVNEANQGNLPASNQEFKDFQRTFLRVYLIALLIDWLQGSYTYVLLSNYAHGQGQIAIIYFGGVIAQLAMSFCVDLFPGSVSPRSLCICCLSLQLLSCVLLLHPAFGGLMMSRISAGLATAIMQTSFETYMVEQHMSHGFPHEWLTQTFHLLNYCMSALAVVSGLIGESFLSIGSITGPFKFGIVLSIINMALIVFSWHRDSSRGSSSIADSSRLIIRIISTVKSNQVAVYIAVAHCCFEASLFVFAMSWAPLLSSGLNSAASPEHPPWGLAFSQLMICVMLGSYAYRILFSKQTPLKILLGTCIFAALSFFLLSSFSRGSPFVIYICWMFEFCVGLYLNAAGALRTYISSEVRNPLLSGARLILILPLYLISVLLISKGMFRASCLFCGGLCLIAAYASVKVNIIEASSSIELDEYDSNV